MIFSNLGMYIYVYIYIYGGMLYATDVSVIVEQEDKTVNTC